MEAHSKRHKWPLLSYLLRPRQRRLHSARRLPSKVANLEPLRMEGVPAKAEARLNLMAQHGDRQERQIAATHDLQSSTL